MTGGPQLPLPPIMLPSTMPKMLHGINLDNSEARSAKEIFPGWYQKFSKWYQFLPYLEHVLVENLTNEALKLATTTFGGS